MIEWGWVFDYNVPAGIDIKKLVAFSNASTIRMFMNYVQHDFTINQDGSVSMTIEYIGSTDAMFETSKSSNIFAILSGDVKKNVESLQDIKDRRASIEKDYNIQGTGDFTDGFKILDKTTGKEVDNAVTKAYIDQLDKDKQALEKINQTNSTSIFESIVNNIYRLYNYDIPYLTLDVKTLQEILDHSNSMAGGYTVAGPTGTSDSNMDNQEKLDNLKKVTDTAKVVTIANKQPVTSADKLFDMDEQNLYYFTFEDLLLAFNLARTEDAVNDFAKILLSDIDLLTIPKSQTVANVTYGTGPPEANNIQIGRAHV